MPFFISTRPGIERPVDRVQGAFVSDEAIVVQPLEDVLLSVLGICEIQLPEIIPADRYRPDRGGVAMPGAVVDQVLVKQLLHDDL